MCFYLVIKGHSGYSCNDMHFIFDHSVQVQPDLIYTSVLSFLKPDMKNEVISPTKTVFSIFLWQKHNQ